VAFLSIFILVGLASLVVGIMTAVDASKYPEWAFQQAGTTKFVWQILPIVLLFLCGFASLVMGGIWFSSKRDEVARAAQSGPPPQYGYGAPPPYPPSASGGWAPPAPPSAPQYPPPPYPPPVPPAPPPQ
jgi:hypothetical protein